jgi:hypothetical protein
MLSCDACDAWVHAACDGLGPDDLAAIERRTFTHLHQALAYALIYALLAGTHHSWAKKYICPPCRHRIMVDLLQLLRNEDRSGYFALPVTADVAPGYFNVITEPMDLWSMAQVRIRPCPSTGRHLFYTPFVSQRLDRGEYDTPDASGIHAFRAAFGRIVVNALTFNTPQDKVYRDAWKFLKAGAGHFASLLPMTSDSAHRAELERLRSVIRDPRYASEGGQASLLFFYISRLISCSHALFRLRSSLRLPPRRMRWAKMWYSQLQTLRSLPPLAAVTPERRRE